MKRILFDFHKHDVTAITYKEEPVFVAHEIETALECAGGTFIKLIRRNPDELPEGSHVLRLVGEELSVLKSGLPDKLSGSRTRNLILLTERGLYRAVMLAGGSKALAFRDWLDGEVLPELRRTGRYALPGAQSTAAETLAALPAEVLARPGTEVLELLRAEAATGAELPGLRALMARSRDLPGPTVPALFQDRSPSPNVTPSAPAHEMARFRGKPTSWLPIWLVLRQLLDDGEWHQIARSEIAEAVGFDLRTARRTVMAFEELGVIEVRRTRGGSYKSKNALRLLPLPEVLVVPVWFRHSKIRPA